MLFNTILYYTISFANLVNEEILTAYFYNGDQTSIYTEFIIYNGTRKILFKHIQPETAQSVAAIQVKSTQLLDKLRVEAI